MNTAPSEPGRLTGGRDADREFISIIQKLNDTVKKILLKRRENFMELTKDEKLLVIYKLLAEADPYTIDTIYDFIVEQEDG